MSLLKLKNTVIALFVLSMLVFSANTFAQTNANSKASGKTTTVNPQNKTTLQHGPRFVDANGDGICDNAIDTNGDGKPDGCGNAQRPMDGTGRKNGMGRGNGMGLRGSGQGTGTGTGVCDGTGPKGRMSGK